MKTNEIVNRAILSVIALVLSYIESVLPFSIGIPGLKLGLANSVIVFALFYFKTYQALLVNFIRIIIIGVIFGNLFGILFSLSGALFSYFIMLLFMKSKKFDIIVVSALGGISHNVAQLIIAIFVVGTNKILFYLPILIIAGLIMGIFNGILAKIVYNRLKK